MKKAIFILCIIFIVTNLKGNDRTYRLENLRIYSWESLMTIMDYSCFDADNCIIVRTDDNLAGLIAEKTSNGGKTWELVYADTSFKSDDSIYYPVHSAQRVKYF